VKYSYYHGHIIFLIVIYLSYSLDDWLFVEVTSRGGIENAIWKCWWLSSGVSFVISLIWTIPQVKRLFESSNVILYVMHILDSGMYILFEILVSEHFQSQSDFKGILVDNYLHKLKWFSNSIGVVQLKCDFVVKLHKNALAFSLFFNASMHSFLVGLRHGKR